MGAATWKARARREAKKKKEALKQRRADIKSAVSAVAKVLPHFGARWHVERAKLLQRALDVLAGEAARP